LQFNSQIIAIKESFGKGFSAPDAASGVVMRQGEEGVVMKQSEKVEGLEVGIKRVPPRICVIIPCFRVRNHILDVLARIDKLVEAIYVVDDRCPDESGRFVEAQCQDPRVRVIYHEVNQGVGGAVLTGVEKALLDKMDICVKIDGDGQLDAALLPLFVRPIIAGEADFTKGNRFYNPDDVRNMPAVRLIGNAALSFLTKLSTGYWDIFDPTNGYIAVDARLLANLPRDKIEKRFLFETDLLFRVGLLRAKVLDIPMTAIYGSEKSNLRIHREILRFFVCNMKNFSKRLVYNYFLRDFNIASLELIFGALFTIFAVGYGIAHWGAGQPASAGIVMIAALPLLAGIMLLLSFVNFDVQQIPRETMSARLAIGRREGA
jgi:glycosyltransferase involved in cell wall biosynthesis